jgi:hypothetical protein
MSENGNQTLGWIDGLSLNKKLTGTRFKDVITFVNFQLSTDAYEKALVLSRLMRRYLSWILLLIVGSRMIVEKLFSSGESAYIVSL